MNPQVIHLYSLVALRALADYDFAEFRRSTDLSKRQVDERINAVLDDLKAEESAQFEEVNDKINELRAVEREAGGQTELSFLLRQLGPSCLQRAYQLALAYARSAVPKPRGVVVRIGSSISGAGQGLASRGEEFTRLGLMRLLRELPGYSAKFEYRIRGRVLDGVLEPRANTLPVILVEAKIPLRSPEQAQVAAGSLRHAASGWDGAIMALLTDAVGSNTIGAINATVRGEVRKRVRERIYVLIYDPETNEFTGDDVEALVAAVRRAEVDES